MKKDIRNTLREDIDWDYKHYLKEIIFIAFFFGLVVNLIQNYNNDELFTAEYTKEMFRNEAFSNITGIISLIYSFFSVLFSVKADYRRYIINYDKSFIKYLIFFVPFVILISVLFINIELTFLNILYCILNLLKNSCLLYFFVSIIFKIKSNSIKI